MDGSYCSLFETTDDDILSLDVKSTARCELPSLVDALGENGIGAEAWCEALKLESWHSVSCEWTG